MSASNMLQQARQRALEKAAAENAAAENVEEKEKPKTEQQLLAEMSPDEKLYYILEKKHRIPESTVRQWKNEYGDIYLLPFDDEQVVVYRAMKSIEHQALLSKVASNPNFTERDYFEQQYKLCVLYPMIDPSQMPGQKAGLLDSVKTAIERSSLFLSEMEIANMIIKL